MKFQLFNTLSREAMMAAPLRQTEHWAIAQLKLARALSMHATQQLPDTFEGFSIVSKVT